MNAYMNAKMHEYMRAFVRMCTNTYTHICIRMCIVRMHIHASMLVYMHTKTVTCRQTEGQIEIDSVVCGLGFEPYIGCVIRRK